MEGLEWEKAEQEDKLGSCWQLSKEALIGSFILMLFVVGAQEKGKILESLQR